jgi:hypothetical protein
MSLEKIYSNVSKSPIRSLSVGGSFPQIEKDPTIKKLTEDVFSQMAELDKKDNPDPEPIMANSPELKTFSFEDAIKELHSMVKKGK